MRGLERAKKKLKYEAFRQMAVKVKESVPHLKGRKRSEILAEEPSMPKARNSSMSTGKIFGIAFASSAIVNVVLLGWALPGLDRKAAKTDYYKGLLGKEKTKTGVLKGMYDSEVLFNSELEGNLTDKVKEAEEGYKTAEKEAKKREDQFWNAFQKLGK